MNEMAQSFYEYSWDGWPADYNEQVKRMPTDEQLSKVHAELRFVLRNQGLGYVIISSDEAKSVYHKTRTRVGVDRA